MSRCHFFPFILTQSFHREMLSANWAAAAKAIAARNGPKAETIVRKALFESRDSAMAMLRRSRGGDVNAAKFVRD
jgi:hypothetical protein